MHKALRESTQTASRVEEFKCRLFPRTNLKTRQDFKRHCNTAEVHPLEISFCDDCGEFFTRKDLLLRHQSNPPPECKSAMQEDAKKKRKEGNVATHCLLEAVVALVARTQGLKVILLEDRGDEGARVCN